MSDETYVHPSAIVDQGAHIGAGTKIWHFCHVSSGAHVGDKCVIGQNVFIGNVTIGNGVRIQNNVSVYDGVTLEDYVFCGPSCVFTNVINPRSEVNRKHEFRPTRVKRGATIGANSTIICGNTIGSYVMIGAGAVVTTDLPDYALALGVPARRVAWMCACGVRLGDTAPGHPISCIACARMYVERDGKLEPLESKK
jgi:UDP-2-acetamido-3-amino-2,3-dideoxy-glucuronate N-acetyltransferase